MHSLVCLPRSLWNSSLNSVSFMFLSMSMSHIFIVRCVLFSLSLLVSPASMKGFQVCTSCYRTAGWVTTGSHRESFEGYHLVVLLPFWFFGPFACPSNMFTFLWRSFGGEFDPLSSNSTDVTGASPSNATSEFAVQLPSGKMHWKLVLLAMHLAVVFFEETKAPRPCRHFQWRFGTIREIRLL